MTLKREIKDAYIEKGAPIYVKTHSNAVYVDDNLTETSIEENNDLKYDLLQLKEIKDDKEYTRRLLDLYIWKEEFRKSWQMSLMIKLFLFISIIEKNYGYEDVQELLEDFDKEKYKQEEIAQSLGIYNFLKQICRPIEINYMVSDEEKNDLVLNDEQKEINISTYKDKQIKYKKKNLNFNLIWKEDEEDEDK